MRVPCSMIAEGCCNSVFWLGASVIFRRGVVDGIITPCSDRGCYGCCTVVSSSRIKTASSSCNFSLVVFVNPMRCRNSPLPL